MKDEECRFFSIFAQTNNSNHEEESVFDAFDACAPRVFLSP
jgi:hypothetical protein